MPHKERAALKTRISRELEDLRAAVEEMQARNAPVEPDVAIGRLSRLDTMLNQGISEASLSNSRQRILKLERALTRLDNDPTFGECAECGERIPEARLLAMPESEFCVRCAE